MALQKAIAKNRMPGLKADGEIEIAQGTRTMATELMTEF